jgi:xylitol oxidase
MPLTNWAGNLAYGTDNVHSPETVEQVREVVKRSRALRPLGSRHSFSRIADGTGDHVSLRRMNRVVSLDRAAGTVTVEAGMRYGDLCGYLHANGFALHNLASSPHICIAGACATATHGSGCANGTLATAVRAIELVDAAGEVVTLSRGSDGDAFRGAVVGLGALGVVTRLTLELEPAFDVSQVVYRDLPLRALEDDFDAILSSGYSVSLFTDWTRSNVAQVWIKRRVAKGGPGAAAADFHGAHPADHDLHPVEGQPAENCTLQLGVPGPWHERLPHFRMEYEPSVGRELQSEYFVPREHAWRALRSMEALHERIAPHLFVWEIRTVAADDLWMSPCHGRACVALHTTWKPDGAAVATLLPLIEEKLVPLGAVPHWGKLFTMAPAVVQSRYPKLADFRELVRDHDPAGKFRNEFLDRYIFGG